MKTNIKSTPYKKALHAKPSNFQNLKRKIKTYFFIDKNNGEIVSKSTSLKKQEIDFVSNLNKNRPEKKFTFFKGIVRPIIIAFFVIAAVIAAFSIIPLTSALNAYNNGFDTTKVDITKVPHIYDKNGNLLMVMYGYNDVSKEGFVPTYSSKYTDLNELPNYISNAFLAIEDHTFYDNKGISFNRLLYATFTYIAKGDSSFGGSTITQQLVKVSTGEDDRSITRKTKEIGRALYLTENWSKSKILASYINLIYYGNGAYGIYEASLTYFGITPDQLNIAQAATIAALPNSPEGLNPYASEGQKTRLMDRKLLVLQRMLELQLITDEEYTEAINFEITFTNSSNLITKNDPAIKQYLDIALTETIEIVMHQYGYDKKKAMNEILYGNTKIYLNLDQPLQRKSYELVINSYPDYQNFELGYVLTNKQGQVLSLVASRTNSQIDHVYNMTRQTGSSIKPLSVYGPAFDMGLLTPNSYINDAPTSVKTASGVWNVNNASRRYMGNVTTKSAIAYSLNTTAVITLERVGLFKSYEYLQSFGITSLTKDDLYYPALGLGGLTYGISPYEMAQAYNVFNNDGVFKSISTVDRIEISDKTIKKNPNEHRVISSDANEMIKTSMLEVGNYGTGRQAKLSNVTTYLKTGTTSNNYDFWTCGFTNDVTAVLWGGYDIPREISNYNVNALWKQLVESYY